MGEAFDVDHGSDLDQLLARADVDAVCVCVPSGLHAEIGVRAARAGKHVVCEKPIDVSLEAADRLIAAAHESGVTLTVISQNRFAPGLRSMKELIDSGRLGKLIIGDSIIKWWRSQEYYDSGDWRGTWELDGGGCLMNQGVHYVDLLQWMMGPVKSLVARTATLAHQRIEVEDVATAMITFESGALGLLHASTAVYRGLPERLEVTGTNGTAVIEKNVLVRTELIDDSAGSGAQAAEANEDNTAADPAALGAQGHAAQIADFIGAVREGRDPKVTGEAARKPLEIILAVYESARRGGPVTFPLAWTSA
jgi:predicted dehydrogenase